MPVALDAVYRKELVVRGSRSATPAYFRDAVELLPQLVLPPVTTLPLERFLEGVELYRRGDGAEGRLHAVKAARLYAPGDLRVEEVPRPEPGPGDVLVQIEVALTDGTDLKTYRRGHPLLARESPALVRARVLRPRRRSARGRGELRAVRRVRRLRAR